MQQIVAQLPNAFTNIKGVTKSHIPATNALERVVVPINDKKLVELETLQKRGRSIGAKNKNLWKRKAASLKESLEDKPLEDDDFSQRAIPKDETQIEIMEPLDPPYMAPREDVINENYEISINFVNT